VKIEQVLVHYLIKTKHLALQGIGTFDLDATIPENTDPEKPVMVPVDAIRFNYNPKTTEDEGLVDFIVIHTKKIKPLASSDLDSYLSLGRQFLNIGKPFVLPGMGTLEKQNSGELMFIPGQEVAPRLEPNKIKNEEERETPEEENLFNDYQKARKNQSGQKALVAIVFLVIIGLIGWAVWTYLLKPNDESKEVVTHTETVVPVADSSRIRDSLAIYAPLNESNKANLKNPADSFTFKVVVNEYTNMDVALRRMTTLKKYNRNVIMYTNDSVSYKLAEPFMLPLSDTTKVLDSLVRFYGKRKLRIE
jgi:hypothetical protein